MIKRCLNCGHHVNSNYCPNCGQSTHVGRINWKSFIAEFIHTLTHAEKSIAGTTWQLIKNPGKVLDEYFAGKRKKYQSPISFFLVWVTISILVHRLVISHNGFNPVYLPGLTFSNPESIRIFITHGEWLYIIAFPVSAFLLYAIAGKPLYSYIECMVIVIYTFSVTYVFFTLCYLIGGVLLSLNVLHWKFYLFQIILSVVYSIWVCITLFRNKKIKFITLRVIMYMIINAVVILKFLEFLSNLWAKIEAYTTTG